MIFFAGLELCFDKDTNYAIYQQDIRTLFIDVFTSINLNLDAQEVEFGVF